MMRDTRGERKGRRDASVQNEKERVVGGGGQREMEMTESRLQIRVERWDVRRERKRWRILCSASELRKQKQK